MNIMKNIYIAHFVKCLYILRNNLFTCGEFWGVHIFLCAVKALGHITHYIKDFVKHENVTILIGMLIQRWLTLTNKWVSLSLYACLQIPICHFSFHKNDYIYQVSVVSLLYMPNLPIFQLNWVNPNTVLQGISFCMFIYPTQRKNTLWNKMCS